MPAVLERDNKIATVKLFLADADYDQTIGAIADAGRYEGGVNPDALIPGRFPVKNFHRLSNEVVLVCFNQAMDLDSAIKGLDNLCLRPAEFLELLMIGAQYPAEQRSSLILTVGPMWSKPGDTRYVPGLGQLRNQRTLSLYPCVNRKWPADTRFAAVSLL